MVVELTAWPLRDDFFYGSVQTDTRKVEPEHLSWRRDSARCTLSASQPFTGARRGGKQLILERKKKKKEIKKGAWGVG